MGSSPRSRSTDPKRCARTARATNERQCWGHEAETFSADDAMMAKVRHDLVRLEKKGSKSRGWSGAGVQRGPQSRGGQVDGRASWSICIRWSGWSWRRARTHGEDIVAACGKVGGYDRYGNQFGPLGGRLHVVLSEGRAKSEYQFPGVGRVAFVRDADETHLLVGMASLVGKWVRDLMMTRVVRYHREVDESLPMASGYHDSGDHAVHLAERAHAPQAGVARSLLPAQGASATRRVSG